MLKKIGSVGRKLLFFAFFICQDNTRWYFGDKYPFACSRMKLGLKL